MFFWTSPKAFIDSIGTCLCQQAGADDADSRAVHRFTRIAFGTKKIVSLSFAKK
jgi:hypothetical protein